MKTLIVCDLSWMMYRSFYSYPEARFNAVIEGRRIPTSHIYGVLRNISSMRSLFPDCDIVLCRDGVPKERIELLGGTVTEDENGKITVKRGEYKEGRGTASYNIHHDAKLICELMSSLNRVYYAYDKYKESDDLMYSLAKTHKDEYDRVYVFSGDNDLLQTIDEKIHVLRSLAKDAVILDSYWVQMESDYKVPPECLPIFRAMRGDVSDNIEGIYPRLSKDFARRVAKEFHSVEEIEWYTPAPSDPDIKWWQRIQNAKSLKLLERNYKLMKLDVFPIELKRSSFDSAKTQEILKLYNLSSWSKYFLTGGGK